MGKQHLAQLFVYELAVLIGRERHVFRGKALHLGAIVVTAFQRHEGRAARCDGVAQFFGKAVTITCGAGERIGKPAGTHGGSAAGNSPRLRHDARDSAVFREDLLRPGLHCPDPCLAAEAVFFRSN